MSNFRRSLFSIAALFMVAGDALSPGAETSSLAGKVSAGASGAPVAGVTLQIDDRRTSTDAQGVFAFRDVPTGRHVIVTTGPNHEKIEKEVELRPGSNDLLTISMEAEAVQVLERFAVKENAEGAAAKFADKAGAEALTEVVSGADLKRATA